MATKDKLVSLEVLKATTQADVNDLKSAVTRFRSALSDGTDLNDLYENGWYYSNNTASLLHQPDETKGRRFVIVYGDSAPASTEILYMMYYNATTGVMAFRVHLNAGDWQPWRIMASQNDLSELSAEMYSMLTGDYTSKLTNGETAYWKTDGTKATSSVALCTNPIFVPKGWGLKVSTAIGSSAYGVCEVTSANAFVSGIHGGSCYNYVFTADHDCYMAVSSISTQLPDLSREIYLLMPEEIPSEEIGYTENKAFDSIGFRYGYYTSEHVYTVASLVECCNFRVKPGDWITANVAIQSNKDAIYLEYDDGTVEAVVGADQSNYLDYDLIAEKEGTCYLSSYYPEGGSPSFSISAITDENKNKRTCAIFKKVVCCGDSYTAGWISENSEGVRNNPNFNFPHYMSTLTGNKWVDAGASGTTVLTWQTNTNGYDIVKTTGKAQAYVIGLGVNDRGDVDIGTPSDIGTDAQTYYGGLSQIIIKLAAISPNAPIFVNTNPNSADMSNVDGYNTAVRTVVSTMAANYRVHLIDLAKYTAFYHRPGLLADLLQGHFTAIGYEQFAELYSAILSEYINHHATEFQNVAFLPYDDVSSDALDMILTDSSAVAISSSATGVNVYGKYLLIGGKVYFKVSILMTADVPSSISNIFANLPEPAYARAIFDEQNPTSVKQKPHVRWNTNKWVFSVVSGFSKGDVAMFYGVYDAAT